MKFKLIEFAFRPYIWAGGHEVLEVLGWGKFRIMNCITEKEETKQYPWWLGFI